MPATVREILLIALLTLVTTAAYAAAPGLAGRWILNHDLTREVQPDGPEQRDLLSSLPRTSVSVGGVPLPMPGGSPPPAPGSARNPSVLHTTHLVIEPNDDTLTLGYDGGQRETLERGNDQGLVSRWNARRLTSRYETTSRSVSQVFEVRRDGRLLVTVKLNPKQGPTLVHKRVFERIEP